MGNTGKKSGSGSSRAIAPDSGDEAVDDIDGTDAELAAEHSARQLSESDAGHESVSDDDITRADLDFGTDNPQTCCSNCQTIFEVSVELLASSDTRVRCGECLSIFDALSNLRDGDIEEYILVDADGNVIESPEINLPTKRHDQESLSQSRAYHEASNLPDAGAAALAGLTNDTSSLDVTYSDFDLFSDEAELPDVAYFDQTRDTSNFDFEEDDENDETFNDSLFAQDVTVDARSDTLDLSGAGDLQNIALDSDVDYITDESPNEPLIFNYRERETRTPTTDSFANSSIPVGENVDRPMHTGTDRDLSGRKGQGINVPADNGSPWLFRSVLFLLALALAGGLYAYRERDSLFTNQHVRPVLEAACSVLNCSVPEPVDLLAIKVVKRAVFSHPSIDNALIINLGFVNEATFNQRYPILEIRLTDRSGRLVVKNNFLPVDYLDTWIEGDKLDAGKRLDISLTVEDPGNTATSFELDFR